MLSVRDGVADHVLEERLEDAAGLFIDERRNALDSSSSGQTTDGRLGDALDVVAEDLPVSLGASLAQSLASLASSSLESARHCAAKDEILVYLTKRICKTKNQLYQLRI